MEDVSPHIPSELELSDTASYLVGKQRDTYVDVIPNQGTSGYRPDGTSRVEFVWSHGDCIDPTMSYLKFNLNYILANGNADTESNMTLASDWIRQVEFYIDSQEVFSTSATQGSRSLINFMLMSEGNGDWYKREAQALIGACLPTLPNSSTNAGVAGSATRVPPQTLSRTFAVPLWCIHPAFAMNKILPVMGSQLRLVLHLAQPADCLNVRSEATSTYRLDEVMLRQCMVLLQPSYKEALLNQMRSVEGFTLRYTDFEIQHQNVNASTSQALTIRNEHQNAQTLLAWNSYINRGANETATHHVIRSDLGNRATVWRVDSGSVQFTGVHGSRSTAEHFVHLERANGSLADFSSSGLYDFNMFFGQVADMAGWACAPLFCSLEKTQASDFDTSIINNGLSGTDISASREITVQINTPNPMVPADERLYTAIVYEKALIFANGRVAVEH